jgi:hypothetical protein
LIQTVNGQMKVTGKPVPAVLVWCFIAFALISAIVVLPGAKESHGRFLYVCIFGGLFVGIPAVLGIAIVHEHLQNRSHITKRH